MGIIRFVSICRMQFPNEGTCKSWAVLTSIMLLLGICEDCIWIVFKFLIKETLVAGNVKNVHGEYEIVIVSAKHDPFEIWNTPFYFLLKIANKRALKGCVQDFCSLF